MCGGFWLAGLLFICRGVNGFFPAGAFLEKRDSSIERGTGIVFRSGEQEREEANAKSTYNTVVLGSIRSQRG
jgi:hypothetical protein